VMPKYNYETYKKIPIAALSWKYVPMYSEYFATAIHQSGRDDVSSAHLLASTVVPACMAQIAFLVFLSAA
jgi:hypothetical protein